MSFHLVLSFMTFLFEYTFICSNILHSKSLVSFGNQLWPQQTEMSHYLPVLPKVLVFQQFQLFVTIERFVSEIHDFRYQNVQFVPNLTNSVISDISLSFLSFGMTKYSISLNIHPFHSFHHPNTQVTFSFPN